MTKLFGIFLVSRNTRRNLENRLLFVCSLEDAKKFCSDDRTQSQSWITIFNSVPEDLSAKNFMKDDGRFDGVITELGIKVKRWSDIDMPRDFSNLTK